MENSIYLGLSKQLALKTDMSIIANNIANMNTTGFRGQNTLFQEYVEDPKGNQDPLSFVYDYGQYKVTKEGPVSETGNPFDVALSGPGFLGVQDVENERTIYTRAGDFHRDEQGQLMSSGGYPVLDAGGAPIQIPDNTEYVTIDRNGILSNQEGEFASLMVVEFEDVQQMKALGSNTYTTDLEGIPAENTNVKQGYLEGSNVNAVMEMTRMIDTLRTYQSQYDIMGKEHERLRAAIQKLTRSS